MPEIERAAGLAAADATVVEAQHRQAGVGQVLPANVVKGLRALAGAHAVDLDHDESQLGELLD